MAPPDRSLFDVWPALRGRLPLTGLGELPTPVQALDPVTRAIGRPAGTAYVKRDDLTSTIYGGNKVRTLEILFGQALNENATHIYSTGAYGSNHSTATVLHAPRVGLATGIIAFPQPSSHAALENLRTCLAAAPVVHALPHWSALPFGMFGARRRALAVGHRPFIMVPGGATPHGALGYVSAALELALQVRAGEIPPPRTIVIGVGSTCTSAGLLLGFYLAARLGIGLVDSEGRAAPPELLSVRVTPWPVTSAFRIVGLATRASQLLAHLAGDPSLAVGRGPLGSLLRVDGSFLGRGYGHATEAGLEAIRLWHEHFDHALDTTYSAKSAAAVVDLLRRASEGPILFWSTKSSAPLPSSSPDAEAVPSRMRAWSRRVERDIARGDAPGPAPWRPA